MSQQTTYTIDEIANIIGGKCSGSNSKGVIQRLVTDSRTLINAPQALFFAVKAQRDGHQFISHAYQNGIRNFVVSAVVDWQNYPGATYITVDDTLTALQELAAHHRRQFDLKVIGITGSNGKTIVKEWLYQLLNADFQIVRSPKSYNSQIGVPLSVWQIDQNDTLGIFEAGISAPKEMENLAKVIAPNIGILTNVREAHDEGFKSKAQKLAEKLKLFDDAALLIYSPDHLLNDVKPTNHKIFTWSFTQPADLQIDEVVSNDGFSSIKAKYQGKTVGTKVPFTDAAAIENVVICWATLLAMGYAVEDAAERLADLQRVGMRLQLVNGIEQCSIIDDSYSADISSLAIALDFLNQQNQHSKRTVILSDLQETGKKGHELYREIASLLQQKKIDRLIGIGSDITAHADLFKIEKHFFTDTDEFLAHVVQLNFTKETILVKGARKFGFERIVKRLAQKIHDTVLEINLNALQANLQYYKSKLGAQVKTMAMVKAFSYGSGTFEIANLLQHHKVDYLAVAYADEGVALRKAGITLPVMVMSPEPSAFDAMLRYQLEPEVYSVELLQQLLRFLPSDDKRFPIHLKLDTGMHRLGFEPHQITELCDLLSNEARLNVVTIFTHLVASDDPIHDAFTQSQATSYEQMYQQLVNTLGYQPVRHVLNTSGITRWSAYQLDMVRLGIGLYGFDSALPTNTLQTVATLKTTITQIKTIQAGQTVGYGRRGVLVNGGEIATVKIGYADGYSRAFGNGVGKMLTNGQLVSTVGSICMDMCMLNVTGLDVKVGDEVIVFGQNHNIADLAKEIDTIPYEILTNVSQRVKRVYYYE
ncbi:bifunctional UDP-N-acetylmuramoyl-tripeptide:D-alanyl-D-alanine ligase/alanine racemase [Pedobacter sp.]